MSDLKPGERVEHIFTGERMTVTGSGYFVDEIKIHSDEGYDDYIDPSLIEPIDGKEKDGSILRQESATASEINTHEKEDSMTQSTANDYNGHMPTPPARFTIGFEDDINGEEFMYCTGPKATSGQITVETFWSIPGGIEYHVTNERHSDNGLFNTDELIELGRLIREVVAATKLSTAENAGIKICITCNEGKLLSEYSKHVSNRDGLQTHCKDCAAEYYAKGNGDDNA
ncbi:hypothetical protein [Corynebacterium casei]|uniref:hypothetical protein n=1 Tax=Actinomycetes TaxID=1760 RepID=UPI003F9E02F3